MENDSISWVTRTKFSRTVYARSGLSALSYSICENQSYSDMAKLTTSSFYLGSSKTAFQRGSFTPVSNSTPASGSKQKGLNLDSSLPTSTRKTDGESKLSLQHDEPQCSFMVNELISLNADPVFHIVDSICLSSVNESNIVLLDSLSCASSLQENCTQSSLPMLNDSNPQSVEFPPKIDSSIPASDTKKLDSCAPIEKKLAPRLHILPSLLYQMEKKIDPKRKSFRQFSTNFLSEVLKEAKSIPKRFSTPNLPLLNSTRKTDGLPAFTLQHDGHQCSTFIMGNELSSSKAAVVHPGKNLRSNPFNDSNLVSSCRDSFNSSLQHGGNQSSLPLPKDLSPPIAEFSFHHDTKKSDSCAKGKKKLSQRLHTLLISPHQTERKIIPKRRSISQIPENILSEEFKEAKSIPKRFSTPPRRRNKSDNNVLRKCFPSMEKKETSWTRYFDNEGSRVTAVETADKWIVDLSQLYFGVRFSCGAHSKLYHGIYMNQQVAVKLIRFPEDDNRNEGWAACLEKQFIRETTFLSHVYHRNVIKLVGACKNHPIFIIITEYLSGGSLRAFLRKLDGKSLPLDKLISIALDVARGMEYIHSQGIIHRDLKPENLIFDKDFCVKIADFGVACEEAYCDAVEEDAGTYRWMAPEMIKQKQYGRKVDVYSFGLLLWEMITGAIPYEDMTPVQAAFAVINKSLRPIIPADCPLPLKILMEQCWSSLPGKRADFWQIVKILEQFESELSHEMIRAHPFTSMIGDLYEDRGAGERAQ